MSRSKVMAFLSVVIIAGVLLAACGPSPTPAAPAAKPPQDTQAPAPTKAPEVTKPEPTAVPTKPPVAATPYRMAVLADITTLNVWDLFGPGSSTWNFVVMGQFYPTLYTQSLKRFDLILSLAAGWATPAQQEGDFWVSTIPIKQGILWSDGTEVTAEDVAWTANTAVTFQLGGNWGYIDSGLDHAEAIDPYTVKFYYTGKPGLAEHEYGVLQSPIVCKAYWEPKVADAVAALAALQDLDPASEEYATKLGEAQGLLYAIEVQDEPVLGPHMFSRWEVGAFVENTAYLDFYWKGAVAEEYVNGAYREYKEGIYEDIAYGEPEGDIELSYVSGPNFNGVLYSLYSQDAAVMALLNGDVDYVYNPSGYGPGLKAQLEQEADITAAVNPANGFRYLGYNFSHPPMDDVAVRQALDCMIDRNFLTQNLLQNAALPAYTAVPVQVSYWYNQDVKPFCDGMSAEERLSWAVQRLKDAGYTWDVEPAWNPDRGGSVEWGQGLKMPNGEYVGQLRLLAPSPGYDPLRATTGVFVEQWANQLGLPVKAELINFNTIAAETIGLGGNFDLVIFGWTLGDTFPDHLYYFYRSDMLPFNFVYWSNPEYDALADQFMAASTMEEARPLVLELQRILGEELPYSILFTTPILDAFRGDTIQYPTIELLDGIYGNAGLQQYVDTAD